MHMPSLHLKSPVPFAVAAAFLGSVAGQAQTTSTSTQAKAPVKTAPAKPAAVKPVPVKAAPVKSVAAKTAAVTPVNKAVTPAAGTTATTPPANSSNRQVSSTAATNVNPANVAGQSAASPQTTADAAAPGASAFAPGGGGSTAGGAQGTPAYAAGLGTFRFGDTTATAFNCLRSGTRVFCDFDETKQQAAQLQAGWAYSAVKLVLGSGRVMSSHAVHFVDQDGSTFDTAELSPNVPVRMIVEYDDVPASYSSGTLAFGGDRIQSVPVTDMPATQAAGIMPARPAPSNAQTQAGAPAGTADPSA